jgi:O-antigen/teichoic acid export membrane protein
MSQPKTKLGRDVVIAGAATVCGSLSRLLILPLLTHWLTMAQYSI